jgi:hypothetical protein
MDSKAAKSHATDYERLCVNSGPAATDVAGLLQDDVVLGADDPRKLSAALRASGRLWPTKMQTVVATLRVRLVLEFSHIE